MYAARDPFEEHADDFAWCEDVIRRNSHSFYRAFSLRPPRKRNGVFAVYALSLIHIYWEILLFVGYCLGVI